MQHPHGVGIKDQLTIKGHWKFTFRDVVTGRVRVEEYDNVVVTAARAAVASWLTSVSPTPASLRVNYSSLGTGTTPPANGDTALETETYRKAISSATSLDNVAYFTAFYTAPEVSGTFREAGLQMNASGTPGSGTLFNRVAINITKALTETMTIDVTVTIN